MNHSTNVQGDLLQVTFGAESHWYTGMIAFKLRDYLRSQEKK